MRVRYIKGGLWGLLKGDICWKEEESQTKTRRLIKKGEGKVKSEGQRLVHLPMRKKETI